MLQPQLIKGNVFKDEDGMIVYISDDNARVPILIESQLKVGTVKAILNSIENPLYPLDSEITE
jgi:hypothetical protein